MKLKHIIQATLFVLTIILIIVFKKHPTIVESIYSNALYPVIASVMSFISGLLPFSISDSFYILLIIGLILGLILVLIKKRTFKWYITKILIGIAYIISLFYILWGFNYYRSDIFARINLTPIEDNRQELYMQTISQLINEAKDNYLPPDFQFDMKTIDEEIENSFKEYSLFLNIPYPCGSRRVKHITFSLFFAKSGILGYFGPFFNEVHINSKLTRWDIPIVTAHEKSHQFGITSEGEANFYAWLVCANSKYKWNRYSASIYALSMFLTRLDKQKFEEIMQTIPQNIVDDIIDRDEYWSKMQNKYLGALSSAVNDAYLKSNNVEDGVQNYGMMVELIMAYKNSSR